MEKIKLESLAKSLRERIKVLIIERLSISKTEKELKKQKDINSKSLLEIMVKNDFEKVESDVGNVTLCGRITAKINQEKLISAMQEEKISKAKIDRILAASLDVSEEVKYIKVSGGK